MDAEKQQNSLTPNASEERSILALLKGFFSINKLKTKAGLRLRLFLCTRKRKEKEQKESQIQIVVAPFFRSCFTRTEKCLTTILVVRRRNHYE